MFNIYIEEAVKDIKQAFNKIKVQREGEYHCYVPLVETEIEMRKMLNGMKELIREKFRLKNHKTKIKVTKSSRCGS